MTDLKKLIELRENYDDDTATDFVTMCFEFDFPALLTRIEKLEAALRFYAFRQGDNGRIARAALEDE